MFKQTKSLSHNTHTHTTQERGIIGEGMGKEKEEKEKEGGEIKRREGREVVPVIIHQRITYLFPRDLRDDLHQLSRSENQKIKEIRSALAILKSKMDTA